MSYLKKPKKRLKYRFEGKKLTDLPADINWTELIEQRKVKKEWIQKWSYWFQTGTPKHLAKTRDIQIEAASRRTHQTYQKIVHKIGWFKRIKNRIKEYLWLTFSAPR